ncbi:hypothetical protein [Hyunsoonleella pacifica]|uniref:Uncharacterized protein n=1 Tax=Hyunsoonleella pacifica TaxID=1080224 RepID=A0A4Q9FRA9_9FLAO|nr:hypothetical protein [Hyunsoonleella pacifica]TBN18544.1 hypothetical protein EYD46_00305 [Hyunsoonleella pacifica]GGD02712.1 hypothetical protein GCM10011368_00620 [Hyunsoonleella pacifica]
MKTRLIIIALLSSQIFYSQIEIQEDNLTIEYVKTKKASQLIGAVTNVRTKSKEIVQYNVKVRIEMIDNKIRPFDVNKFSLIDHQAKIRLRPLSVTYTNFTDKWYFIQLIKNKPKYKSLEDRYKPDIKDTFLDYEFEGVNNLIAPICYEAYDEYKISFKNPDKECHLSYFEPKDLRKRNINLYFPMQKSVKNATLYYGYMKIVDIKLK